MTCTIKLSTVLSVSPDQVSADLSSHQSGSIVILGLRDGLYFELDAVGARIWQLIQQPRSLQSVRDALIEEYDVGTEQCENDLLRLAGELVDRGLAVVADGSPS